MPARRRAWRRWRSALGLVALAFLFLADIFFVVTSRTALLVAPVLLLLLGWREFRWKGLVGAVLVGVVVSLRGLVRVTLSARTS